MIEGVTGVFFDRQTTEDLIDAVLRFEKQEWSPHTIRKHAEGFDRKVFRARFAKFLRRIGAPIDERFEDEQARF